MSDLIARLEAAHLAADPSVLSALYTEAADLREGLGDVPAACFMLTHAYVYALQAGLGVADDLQFRLWQHGREEKPQGCPL